MTTEQKRSTKIVATLGPACESPEMIQTLIQTGVNLFRLNFSHGSAEQHRNNVNNIRAAAENSGVRVGILQDLQGPKIRVGRFAGGQVELKPGQPFELRCQDDRPGDANGVSISYNGLCADMKAGDTVLLDDGKIRLEVTEARPGVLLTRVIVGGTLSNNKGINVPSADLSLAAMTEKDIEDLALGASLGVDWVALSFVRHVDDLKLARHYLALHQSSAKLMAKIEKPAAVENFRQILHEADGIMVARGDLGVELSPEKVPMIQKKLIRQCREAGKPVITATQMLESMVSSPIPTRAEANDVANAIYDGTDAVMLSAETAVGKYPAEAIKVMNNIALTVEKDPDFQLHMQERPLSVEANTPDAVSSAATHISRTLDARVLVCFSSSGATALRVSRFRMPTPVTAISPHEKTCNQLTLSWGVLPVLTEDAHNTEEMVDIAQRVIRQQQLADAGDRFVITAGVPFGTSGTTNLLRVERLKSSG